MNVLCYRPPHTAYETALRTRRTLIIKNKKNKKKKKNQKNKYSLIAHQIKKIYNIYLHGFKKQWQNDRLACKEIAGENWRTMLMKLSRKLKGKRIKRWWTWNWVWGDRVAHKQNQTWLRENERDKVAGSWWGWIGERIRRRRRKSHDPRDSHAPFNMENKSLRIDGACYIQAWASYVYAFCVYYTEAS